MFIIHLSINLHTWIGVQDRYYNNKVQLLIQLGVIDNGGEGTGISNHDVEACLCVTWDGNSETNSIQKRIGLQDIDADVLLEKVQLSILIFILIFIFIFFFG